MKKYSLHMRRSLYVLIVAAALTLCQSCYHYRVSTSNFDPGTGYEKKTVCSLFWGLAQTNVTTFNCDSLKINSIDEVRVSTNLGYAMITVVTLGICSPMTIEWKCSKPCRVVEGEIP